MYVELIEHCVDNLFLNFEHLLPILIYSANDAVDFCVLLITEGIPQVSFPHGTAASTSVRVKEKKKERKKERNAVFPQLNWK